MRRQTYGYLPGRRALPLLLGGLAGIGLLIYRPGEGRRLGWPKWWVAILAYEYLHTKTIYPRTVTHISTSRLDVE